jgi:hypothetical protein
MREEALRSVLLVKSIEEADRAGTLIPTADRAAATREASRGGRPGGGVQTGERNACCPRVPMRCARA